MARPNDQAANGTQRNATADKHGCRHLPFQHETGGTKSLASHLIQTRGKSQVSEVPVNDLISLPSKTLNRGNWDFPFYEVPFPDLLVDQAFSLAESNHCLATHNTATSQRRQRTAAPCLPWCPAQCQQSAQKNREMSDRSSSIIASWIVHLYFKTCIKSTKGSSDSSKCSYHNTSQHTFPLAFRQTGISTLPAESLPAGRAATRIPGFSKAKPKTFRRCHQWPDHPNSEWDKKMNSIKSK